MFFTKKPEKEYEAFMSKWFSVWGSGPYDPNKIEATNISKKEQAQYEEIVRSMASACVQDFKNDFKIDLDYTLDSLKDIDSVITPETRKKFESVSKSNDINNQLLIFICEIGAYLGEVLNRQKNGKWNMVYPYWDSPLLVGKTEAFWPFHWVIKAFSGQLSKNGGNLYAKYMASEKT